MVTLIDLIMTLIPLLYGLAMVNYIVYFNRRDSFTRQTCTPVLFMVAVIHLFFILARSFYFGRHPLGSLPEALSVTAFSIAIIYLYVEQLEQSKSTGPFILPMVVILQGIASVLLPFNVTSEPTSLLLRNPLFGLHTAVAVLGYSAFAVGAVYGVMYLLLYRSLKSRSFGVVFERLPSLDVLSKMGFGSTLLGWFFLTATIILGGVMSFELFPDFYRDPKFITTIAVWCVYGATVVSYLFLGWRGARSVYLSLAGFIFAILVMVASALLWPSFHKFMS